MPSFNTKAPSGKEERRIVVVRVPKSRGVKQGSLPRDGQTDDEYMRYVTNTTESEVAVHARYNQRGEAESNQGIEVRLVH